MVGLEASESGDTDARLLAAVLFALAAQQGNSQAIESLNRHVQIDLANRNVEREEEFLAVTPGCQQASTFHTIQFQYARLLFLL